MQWDHRNRHAEGPRVIKSSNFRVFLMHACLQMWCLLMSSYRFWYRQHYLYIFALFFFFWLWIRVFCSVWVKTILQQDVSIISLRISATNWCFSVQIPLFCCLCIFLWWLFQFLQHRIKSPEQKIRKCRHSITIPLSFVLLPLPATMALVVRFNLGNIQIDSDDQIA
jgi:hypothetical protein